MKKILLLTIFIASMNIIYAQTPIYTKTLTVNAELGIHENLNVWSINVNAHTSTIVIDFEIAIMTKTDSALFVHQFEYKRFNQPQIIKGNDTIPANLKFDFLMSASFGQAVKSLITNDFNSINNFTDSQKLKQ